MDDFGLSIEGLGKLVDSVARKIVDLMKEELPLQRLSEDPMPESKQIYGINPYQLYTTREVADRFHMTPSGVRRLSEEELPRAPWQGAEIRYRGIEVLRYEGVPVEDWLGDDATIKSGRESLGDSKPILSSRQGISAPKGRSGDQSREARSPAPSGGSSSRGSAPSNPSDPEEDSSRNGPRNNHPNLPELCDG